MQIYPHKAKINANIASIYAIINPKNAPERHRNYSGRYAVLIL